MVDLPPPTPVGIQLTEYRVAIYRPSVPRGRVTLNVANEGEDGHDLEVRGPRGGRVAAAGEVPSEERTALTFPARRTGRYRLLCTLYGHEELGMRATLTVREPARGRPTRR